MIPFIIVAIICAPLLYYVAVYREKKQREAWEHQYPPYRMSASEPVWQTRIANIRYQCNRDDIGVVIFAVKPEPNDYNADSMSIIRDDGKLLGFIRKREAHRFNRWAGGEMCSGMGMIQYDEATNKLWADIFVFPPHADDEQVETYVKKYLEWVTDVYGAEYIPDRYRQE